MLHVNKCLSSGKCETQSLVVFLTGYVPKSAVADSQANSHQMDVCEVFCYFLKVSM